MDYIAAPEGIAAHPRRRNAAGTTAAILAAAQKAFATDGYTHSGLREIAAAAGVNATLIKRYFGSKEKLFEATLNASLDISALIAGGQRQFGAHVMEYLLKGPGERGNPLPMMILASADPVSRELALQAFRRLVIGRLGAWLGGPDGDDRAARIMLLLSGFFTYWKVLPLATFAGDISPATRLWLERSLQAIVDEAP